jgi:O-antigen ligase
MQIASLFNTGAGTMARYIATGVGLVFAATVGILIGTGDFRTIGFIGALLFAVLFVLHLYRYFWQMSLFLILFNFIYRPFGFAFGGLELSVAAGTAVLAMFVWRKRVTPKSDIPAAQSLALVEFIVAAWLLYSVLHFAHTLRDPFSPADFSLGNVAKTYFGYSAPLFLFLCFSRAPGAVDTGPHFFTTISRICLVALLINCALRLYQIRSGTEFLYIPWIEAIDNRYTLRTVGPLAALLGAVGLTRHRWGEHSVGARAMFCVLIVGGVAGSVVSGGRASLVMSICFIAATLFLRRKFFLLFIALILAASGIGFANLFASEINTGAHPMVQRSLQWVLLEKGNEASHSIESSSRWRAELADRAFDEWRSHPRIFWFGRATYSYTSDDETAIFMLGGYEAIMQSALRRGATHNLITDLLITFGLIGCVIYLLMYFAIILYLWQLHRSRNLNEEAGNLGLVSFVAVMVTLLSGLVAGSSLAPELAWFIIILTVAVRSGTGLVQPSRTSPPPAPAGVARVATTMPMRRSVALRQNTLSLRSRRKL